jgi:hypothetical protein
MKRALIYVLLLLLCSCYQGVEYCEEYESFYLSYCRKQPTHIVAANIGDHYQKSPTVWRYSFSLPGSSVSNCDLSFLETKAYIEQDSVRLVKWPYHNVGNALYTVHKIIPINVDSSRYWLKQQRETFMGVYHNDGVCDGGGSPAEEYFYVRLNACREYAMLGDSFGIAK